MQRLAYIGKFLEHHNDGSGDEIYRLQVQPRLGLKKTRATVTVDGFFLEDNNFETQSPFLKAVRRCVINFERNVMSKVTAVPYWGRNEWAARVEEITFIKALCIECHTSAEGDSKLKDFIVRMRENAKTAFIFGQAYNALVFQLIGILQKYGQGKLALVEFVVSGTVKAKMEKDNSEKEALHECVQRLEHQLREKDDVIREKDKVISAQAKQLAKNDEIIAHLVASNDKLQASVERLMTENTELKAEIAQVKSDSALDRSDIAVLKANFAKMQICMNKGQQPESPTTSATTETQTVIMIATPDASEQVEHHKLKSKTKSKPNRFGLLSPRSEDEENLAQQGKRAYTRK